MTLALLLTAVGGAWAQDTYNVTFKANGNTKTVENVTLPKTFQCSYNNADGDLDLILKELYGWTGDSSETICANWSTPKSSDANKVVAGKNGNDHYITIDNVFEGTVTITGDYIVDLELTQYSLEISIAEPDVEVTTNAAEEGATFTEATFAMPAFDATAEYELVRDMGYKVAFSGVPTRARLAKDGEGKFHFADRLTFQLLDNIDAANPKDITSAEGITFMVGEVEAVVVEGHTFYQLNKATLVPLADFLADAHLGNYAICAVASTGEYDGSFSSGRITLFQGYEVTIPAGEYITYYRDEPLKLDDNETNAELYTISAVGTETATLSGPYDAMKALTPMLVHNKNTEEAKTILLIPCNEPDLALTVAPEFKGTLEATEIAASSATSNNYAFNGKQFVWVKNAIAVGQYKAWLEIPTGEPTAPALTLVFGDATGIDTLNAKSVLNGNWYDLNGRKLQGIPTKKGVYIFNGKKVVVK